uniref:RNase A-like domain-containing protein n=1 Tax=Nocardioides sp. TaxID=35761 RepID=UPI002B26F77E
SLKAHEGGALKGHTMERHVGKSDDYLRHRLRTERKTEVSTFTDEAAAERSIDVLMTATADRLDHFLRGNKQATEFQAPVSNPGRVMSSSGAVTEGTGARILLRKDPSMPEGYRIITAFVVP